LQVIQAPRPRWRHGQRAQDAQDGRRVDDDGNTRGPGGGVCQRPFGVPEHRAQENFTDPDSRIMKTGEGFSAVLQRAGGGGRRQPVICGNDGDQRRGRTKAAAAAR